MSCANCACGTNPNHLHIPPRGPWDALNALGVRRTCQSTDSSVQVAAPDGWSIQPSSVSPFHHHLVDDSGNAVACLLTKPGSGGTGSFQMTSHDNCADSCAH